MFRTESGEASQILEELGAADDGEERVQLVEEGEPRGQGDPRVVELGEQFVDRGAGRPDRAEALEVSEVRHEGPERVPDRGRVLPPRSEQDGIASGYVLTTSQEHEPFR